MKSRRDGRKTQGQILGSYFLELRGECHRQDNLKTQQKSLSYFSFYESEKQKNSRRIRNKDKEADTQQWLSCHINKEEPTEKVFVLWKVLCKLKGDTSDIFKVCLTRWSQVIITVCTFPLSPWLLCLTSLFSCHTYWTWTGLHNTCLCWLNTVG